MAPLAAGVIQAVHHRDGQGDGRRGDGPGAGGVSRLDAHQLRQLGGLGPHRRQIVQAAAGQLLQAAQVGVQARGHARARRAAHVPERLRLGGGGHPQAESAGLNLQAHQLIQQRFHPGILAGIAQGHVGRAPVARQDAHVRQRRLESLGDQAAHQRDVVGHVVGDQHDVPAQGGVGGQLGGGNEPQQAEGHAGIHRLQAHAAKRGVGIHQRQRRLQRPQGLHLPALGPQHPGGRIGQPFGHHPERVLHLRSGDHVGPLELDRLQVRPAVAHQRAQQEPAPLALVVLAVRELLPARMEHRRLDGAAAIQVGLLVDALAHELIVQRPGARRQEVDRRVPAARLGLQVDHELHRLAVHLGPAGGQRRQIARRLQLAEAIAHVPAGQWIAAGVGRARGGVQAQPVRPGGAIGRGLGQGQHGARRQASEVQPVQHLPAGPPEQRHHALVTGGDDLGQRGLVHGDHQPLAGGQGSGARPGQLAAGLWPGPGRGRVQRRDPQRQVGQVLGGGTTVDQLQEARRTQRRPRR